MAKGFKTNIARQLRLNGALFWNSYHDFQARVSGVEDDPILGVPGARLSVLNAGKLRIRGAELEAAWTPVDRLLIDGQLGYLDADYKEFEKRGQCVVDQYNNYEVAGGMKMNGKLVLGESIGDLGGVKIAPVET